MLQVWKSWGNHWDIFPNCRGCDKYFGNLTEFLYIHFSEGLYQVSKQLFLHLKFRMLFLKPKIFPTKFHSKHIEIFIFAYSESYILYIWSKKLTTPEH